MVKNPAAMQESQVRSLGGEDPLEKGMATHSRIFAWRIPWTDVGSAVAVPRFWSTGSIVVMHGLSSKACGISSD